MATLNINTQSSQDQINKIIDRYVELSKYMEKTGSIGKANYNKLTSASREYLSMEIALKEAMSKTNTQLKNMTKSQKSYVTQLKNQKEKTAQLKTENDRLNASLKRTERQTKKTRTGFSGMLGGVKSLIAAFGVMAGVQLFANIVKDIFQTIKTFDSLGFALDRIAGNSFAAADSQRFLLEITRAFGTELVSTTNRWIKFLAAAKQSGLTTIQTEDIFRSMTKTAGVLGLKTDELTGIYLALEQMLSKGKVTTEELRRQLGERLPGAMGIMAASIGVTLPVLDKMLKKGEVISAEVLPNFARAVELAFGIESVEKVETLVAAQNRLATSYQNWVDKVFNNSTALQSFFGGLTILIDNITFKLTGLDGIIDKMATERTAVLKKQLDIQFGAELEAQKGKIGLEVELAKRKADLAKEVVDLDTKPGLSATQRRDELIALKKQQDEVNFEIVQFALQRQALIAEHASKNLDETKFGYDKEVLALKDLKERKEKIRQQILNKEISGAKEIEAAVKKEFGGESFIAGEIEDIDGLTDEIKLQAIQVGQALAKYTLYKKLVEIPLKPELDPDGGDGGSGTKLQRLNGEKDLELEIQKEIFENHVKAQNDILKSDKTTVEERKQALEDWYSYQQALSYNAKQIALRDLDDKNAAELAKNTELQNEGKLFQGEFDRWLLEQENNTRQQLILINEKYNQSIIDDKEDLADKLNTITEENFQSEIAAFTALKKAEIGILKEEYLLEETSAKRKKEIIKEVGDLEFEIGNLIIQKTIEVMEAKLALMDATDKEAIKLKEIIIDLKESLSIKPKDDDKKAWKEHFEEVLEFAKKFMSEVEGLGNALFNRNIERIGAEIVAEEERYDKKIAAAEGDDAQQKHLAIEKEARVKILEKKRLKEEQKQAKFNKGMALAEIAINTAIAISKVAAQTGIFALAGIGPIILLGALQTATVLATPIPQYKDGGKIKEAHVGMINDGGKKEYVERGGELYASNTKNALVDLMPGDVIHKDFDSMKNNSNFIKGYDDVSERDIMMFTAYNKSQVLQQRNLDKMLIGIEKSIDKGFKKVKINNTIKNQMINDYGQSLSRWN